LPKAGLIKSKILCGIHFHDPRRFLAPLPEHDVVFGDVRCAVQKFSIACLCLVNNVLRGSSQADSREFAGFLIAGPPLDVVVYHSSLIPMFHKSGKCYAEREVKAVAYPLRDT
jgi:hypothetical protein